MAAREGDGRLPQSDELTKDARSADNSGQAGAVINSADGPATRALSGMSRPGGFADVVTRAPPRFVPGWFRPFLAAGQRRDAVPEP